MNSILVISVEPWPLASLGCYGLEERWTPALDQFATRSIVFDQHWADDVRPGPAWFTGKFSYQRTTLDEERFWPLLEQAGIDLQLLASESSPIPDPRFRTIPGGWDSLVEASLEVFARRPESASLIWIHGPGPLLEGDSKPLWNLAQAPVDRIREIDRAIGRLVFPERTSLTILTARLGTKGPLGEESLHIPLIVRPASDTRFEPVRVPTYVQTCDLPASILDWFNLPIPETWDGRPFWDQAQLIPDSGRELVLIGNGIDQFGILADSWELIQTGEESELYSKPDDRWELENLSIEFPEATETLRTELKERLQ